MNPCSSVAEFGALAITIFVTLTVKPLNFLEKLTGIDIETIASAGF